MNNKKSQWFSITIRLQWLGMAIGLLYWLLESALDALLFHQANFLESVFTPDANELWMRLFTICLFVIFGYFAQTIHRYKHEEEALKKSEERYRTLFDSMGQGLGIQDKNGFITFINKRACEMLGYKSDELLGKPVTFVFDEENQKIMQEQMKQRHEGKYQSYEIEFKRKDGVNVPTIISPSLLFDSKGSFEGSIAVFTDITERKRAEQKLALFRTLLDHSNDAIEVVDPETGYFIDMNEKALLDLNYSREELPFLRVWDIDPAVDQSSFPKIIEGLRKSGSIIWNSHHQRKDGSKFPVEINIKYVQLDRDYVITVVRDVTERKRAEAELETSLSLLHTTIESTADGILVVNNQGKIMLFNKKFIEMWHIPEPIVMSHDDDKALAHVLEQLKDPEGFLSRVRELYSQPDAESFDCLEFKDGRVFERYSRSQHIEGKSVGRVWSFRDVTERIQTEEKIKHMAYHDPLTNLPNRSLFYDRLHHAILAGKRESKPLALFILDMDGFKQINDTAGHHYGDLVLKAVSQRLSNTVRKSDTVARLGGDEFAILLPGDNMDGAVLTAHKILEAIRMPLLLEEKIFNVGVSIGIALFPEHGEDSGHLLQKADKAMYSIKQSGIGYAVYVQGKEEI